QRLLDGVRDGSLDMALVYSPPQRSGLVCELLREEKLVMVTTDRDGLLRWSQYVDVDWGAGFAANHEAAFPERPNPPVSISLGPLALSYLLNVGGTGYFRAGTVMALLDAGTLFRVKG